MPNPEVYRLFDYSTSKYLTPLGSWTPDFDHSATFANWPDAASTQEATGLLSVRVNTYQLTNEDLKLPYTGPV